MRVSIFIFLLSAVACVAAPPDRLAIKGRQSEASIRQTLLDHTPVGSKASDVTLFLNARLKHEGGHVPSVGNGSAWHLMATGQKKKSEFEFASVPDLAPRFEEPWIGSNFDLRLTLSIYQGFPFKVWVIATWRFNRSGTLTDIMVQKQADAL